MGVGSVRPASGTEPGGFVHLVDQLLYKAKQSGRNRIESASA
jgi:PleD family two-component response regulator